jgi:RNase P/RNase MRP subunit POP5
MHADQPNNAADAIAKRSQELFGSIGTEKAAIRLVKSEGSMIVIRCRLEQLENVLVAIALTNPPVVTLDMSGSMRQLKRRH